MTRMQPRSSAVVAAALGALLAGCPGCGDDAVDPGDGSSVESQTLLLTVGASGLSDPVSFVVPPDALSLHLTARAPGATGKLAFELSQDGQLRVSYQTPATADDALLSVHDELAWGTPASTAGLARSPGGSWEVKLRHLGGALPAPVPVLAVWRRAGPPERGEPRGRLGVSLVLVGRDGDSAAEAAARRALDGAANLLDLPIDVAAVVHVDGAAAAPFATVDVSGGADAAGMRALFAQPLGLPALGTLPLFVVPRLTETTPTGGLDVFGSSGGIPIPVASGGAHGGVAVSAAALALDRRTGTIAIAHELGHALGLLHTSEPSGGAHDHLTSTPECTSARDSDGSGTVLPEECSGAGAENLMFWALGSAAPTLSAEQHAILNRSPLLVKWPAP
ncbi:MAG: hypothetical protein IT370_03395 [Deltaproteobacteria bacterium]|nr:hypothetical protein [Deltaproteobacteria bacterium]